MNIWHNISPKRINPNDFVAVIEIAKGSKIKYELDISARTKFACFHSEN